MTNLFMTVLDMTLKGSFVICSVYLARWFMCLGNPPRKWCYMLWGIVLLRLLLPVSIETTFSALPHDFSHGFAEKWGDDYIGESHTYFDVTEEFQTAVDHGITPVTTDEGGRYVVTGEDGISPPKTVKSQIFPFLAQLWLAGIAVMLLWNGRTLWKLRCSLQEAIPLSQGVSLSDRIDTAFVWGFGTARIYLPSNLTETQQQHILRHEQYHIRRGDHRIKLLAFLALCIHWFNPLVWLAYVEAMRDMELSCDEAVTAELDAEHKADYAQTLLSLTVGHKRMHAAPVAFGEGDTARRIHHIFAYQPPHRAVTILVMVIFSFTAFRLLTDPKEINHQFGASMYGYERIAYEDFETPISKHPYSFCLTTDNVFWALDHSYGWTELGTPNPCAITADEMLSMLHYRLAEKDTIPITRITDAKIVCFPDDEGQHMFYLLTRHEEGKHYIAYGISDSESYRPHEMTILALYPVYAGVGEMSSNGPFYTRCLESMLDVGVDVFSTYHAGDGWQIVGFRTGVPKTDYGWAVFHIENNAAVFTGQMQWTQDAANTNNGILISTYVPDNDTEKPKNKSIYYVALISNPNIVQMQFHTFQKGKEHIKEYNNLSAPDMVVIPWTITEDSHSVAFGFYDGEGNLVPDTATEQVMHNIAALEAQIRETEADGNIHFAPGRLSYMTEIAEAYLEDPIEAAKQELPAGIIQIDRFLGEHNMVQFALRSSLINQYRGYYYSPDDVPLAFQNADVTLVETPDGWTWQDETGNQGSTERIAEQWFRYTADF